LEKAPITVQIDSVKWGWERIENDWEKQWTTLPEASQACHEKIDIHSRCILDNSNACLSRRMPIICSYINWNKVLVACITKHFLLLNETSLNYFML